MYKIGQRVARVRTYRSELLQSAFSREDPRETNGKEKDGKDHFPNQSITEWDEENASPSEAIVKYEKYEFVTIEVLQKASTEKLGKQRERTDEKEAKTEPVPQSVSPES
jgi:hypothetical protein